MKGATCVLLGVNGLKRRYVPREGVTMRWPKQCRVSLRRASRGATSWQPPPVTLMGSCLKTGQHFIFLIIYLLLLIISNKYTALLIIYLLLLIKPYQRYCLIFLLPIIIIMILIMKILFHNEYKIINLWYPTYVYQFFNFS